MCPPLRVVRDIIGAGGVAQYAAGVGQLDLLSTNIPRGEGVVEGLPAHKTLVEFAVRVARWRPDAIRRGGGHGRSKRDAHVVAIFGKVAP